MKRAFALAVAVLLSTVLNGMVLARSNDGTAAPEAEKGAPAQGVQTDESAAGPASGKSVSGNAGLSKHNKAMLEQAEQRKQRLGTIEKERAADQASQE
jgi:hypothetical protein